MNPGKTWLSLAAALALIVAALPAFADSGSKPIKVDVLASGLAGSIGGTVGPDGALYVPQGALGNVVRIDPETGQMSTFAHGLPPFTVALPVGGPMDVTFAGGTAYVLVTLVGPETFGPFSTGENGVYRVNADGSATLIADLGAFSAANPPVGDFEWFAPGGVQYAIEAVSDGLIVTDGHHNRLLHVGFDGATSVLKQYGNVVPAGLDIDRGRVLLAWSGAITEIGDSGLYEEIGEVVSLRLDDPANTGTVAAGISMAVDVQRGPGHSLYALSQGQWDPTLGPEFAGLPAMAFTGQLLRVNADGSTTVIVDGLLLPTSLHFIGSKAYIVTLAGQVLRVRGVMGAKRP